MKLKMPVSDALITAILGYLVVFIGLALLMVVIIIMGKIMVSRSKAVSRPSPALAPAEPAPVKALPEAPGSAGELKLHDVPEREAAMIMAIVANKLRRPLNELRFKSIREVK